MKKENFEKRAEEQTISLAVLSREIENSTLLKINDIEQKLAGYTSNILSKIAQKKEEIERFRNTKQIELDKEISNLTNSITQLRSYFEFLKHQRELHQPKTILLRSPYPPAPNSWIPLYLEVGYRCPREDERIDRLYNEIDHKEYELSARISNLRVCIDKEIEDGILLLSRELKVIETEYILKENFNNSIMQRVQVISFTIVQLRQQLEALKAINQDRIDKIIQQMQQQQSIVNELMNLIIKEYDITDSHNIISHAAIEVVASSAVMEIVVSSKELSVKKNPDKSSGYCACIVSYVKLLNYNNLILNKEKLLFEAAKIGGIKAISNLIELGKDSKIAKTIIELIELYGSKCILKLVLTGKIDLSKIKIEQAEQNFFLNNEQGREFIQAVANHFDKEILLKILELGREQEIAEQIFIEAETQGINMVISTLLGKELPAANTATDSLKNIISQDELNQLRLIPNGILNGWSNTIYKKTVDYIDNLAKNLDDLLNTGKSGSQVAVTLALLEEWLEFAASGQRFIGGRHPYYNPDDNNDWLYGNGRNNDGNNNSSARNLDSQNEFVGLMLPVYNSTDYNDSNHQM